MSDEKPIPPEEWKTIVANVPLVSVDLIVKHDGGVLLGKRENEPAKGEWFVPGGTVLKNEPHTDAVHRVAEEELGKPVVIDEHFYDTAEIDDINSKHYLATGYRCHLERDDPDLIENDQHSALDVLHPPFDDHHPYVERYLDELES